MPAAHTAPVADAATYPYSTVLKMFMSFRGGASVGTAFVVGRRAVLTCGSHACHAGEWVKEAEFVPRFRNGERPLGTFAAVAKTTLREFVQLPPPGHLAYDLAAFVVDRDFPPELGVARLAVNVPLTPGTLRGVGFPAAPRPGLPFDGRQMWESVGRYEHEADGGFGTTTPRVFAQFSDLTGGSAGGPMFTTGPDPVVVGLNGHVKLPAPGGPPESPPRVYSPFLGEAVNRLLRWLDENGGGMPTPPAATVAATSPPPVSTKRRLQTLLGEMTELISRLPD